MEPTVESSRFSKKKLITIPRNDTLQKLNEYRLSSHLCDVFLVADGREFPAHRAVLATGGGFFRGLFASNMREQDQNKIELPQVDPHIMDDMLGYIYTGQIQVTQENAQLIIMAADFLLLEELKDPVDEFLAQVFEDCLLKLTPRDSDSTLQFAYQYNCNSLAKVILKQVCNNFEKIITESEAVFLEFSVKAIHDILSSDDIIVSGEEVVFTALMKWIRHREEREQLLDQLLAHVRLCSLHQDSIHSVVMKDPLVLTSPECVDVVQKHLNTNHDPTNPNQPHPRDCLDAYIDAILVTPHDDSCSIPNGMWCYIPSTNSWFHIPTTTTRPELYGHGKPYYDNGYIYTVLDEVCWDKLYVDRYKLDTNTWSPIIDGWEKPTWAVGIAYLKGIVYVIGGIRLPEEYEEEECQCSDQVFACDLRSSTPSFRQVASLNMTRDLPCAVTDENYIYVIGGETDLNWANRCDSETDTIERYDPESNSWSYLSPIQFSKVAHGSPNKCMLVNGKIFVIQTTTAASKFNLMYDISSDTWSQLPPSPISPNNGFLAYSQDKLYLISGNHSKCEQQDIKKFNIIKTVCYDLKKKVWSDVISSIEPKLDNNGREGRDFDHRSINLTGTAVRMRKDFVSGLQLLEDVDPQLL